MRALLISLKWDGSTEGVFSLGEIASGKVLPPPPLFSGLLLDNTLTMVTAPPFTGKSMLLAAMAVSLDSGLPLMGRFAPAEGKRVLAFLQDAPTWDYAEQLGKVVRGYGLTKEQQALLETRLVLNRGVQLTDPKFLPMVEEWHKTEPFDVLLLDAFWTLHGLNENDNSQMGYVIGALKRMREWGLSIIFTHHDRKPTLADSGMNANYRARGATVISAGVDFHVILRRVRDRVQIILPKARGGMESLLYYDMKDTNHPDGPAVALVTTNLEDTRQGFVLKQLANGPQTRAQLIAAMWKENGDMTRGKVERAVDNDLQLLRSVGKVQNVRHGVWSLPSALPS